MTNLRKEARMRCCMIRVPGVCNHREETVVGCHYRLTGISGMSLKPDDLFIAWGCSDCHAYVDTHHDDAARRMHLEGVIRTQQVLKSEGVIHVR